MTILEGLIPLHPGIDRHNPPPSEREAMLGNTGRIQTALDRLAETGGGSFTLPNGEYWIRTLFLPSNTVLELGPSTRLVAWPVVADYERYRRNGSELQHGYNDNVFGGYSLIIASEAENVGLSGTGIIDGNGFAFWDIPVREHLLRGGKSEELELAPNVEDDSPFWREKRERVSPLIEFDSCRNVRIRDVTILDSPGWTLHPFRCEGVDIDSIIIRNHLYGPNTDGIDLNGCRDVRISGCRVSCGDDAIIIKASADAGPSERISVSDCVLETHCAAFGIGAEVNFPIRDIMVTGVTVKRALRMIQIELWEPGLVENVVISGMTGATMTDIPLERPIYIDIQHHGRTDGKLGAVRNVQVHGFSAVTRGRCLFTAGDGATIEGLILNGIQLTLPEIEDPAVSVPSSRSNQMSNSNPETRAARSAFVFDNVRSASLRDIQIRWPDRDAADRASQLRGCYDWGELRHDRRKQESLYRDIPMHAFLFRSCKDVFLDAPRSGGFGAERIAYLGDSNVYDSTKKE